MQINYNIEIKMIMGINDVMIPAIIVAYDDDYFELNSNDPDRNDTYTIDAMDLHIKHALKIDYDKFAVLNVGPRRAHIITHDDNTYRGA